jgi:hypothetical protein
MMLSTAIGRNPRITNAEIVAATESTRLKRELKNLRTVLSIAFLTL